MNLGYFSYPMPANEPVYNYAPGSIERETLKKTLLELKSKPIDIPMYIGGDEVRTGNLHAIHPPHESAATIAHFHVGDETHDHKAIEAALTARHACANMSWENRANIFLRAADLISTKYRYHMNGTT